MTMSRKDYEQIADRIRRNRVSFAREPQATLALACLAQDLAADFAAANPRFDRQRFLDATRPDPSASVAPLDLLPKTQTQ